MRRAAAVLLAAVLTMVVVMLGTPGMAEAQTWPTWGNMVIPDCTFAAAANWELAALGHKASEATIESEYWAAGGTATGIAPARFSHWWRTHGIGGVRAILREAPNQSLWTKRAGSRAALKHLLGKAHYLLAALAEGFGHAVLVVAAGRGGVTYVTYGEEEIVSWPEWYEGVVELDVVTPLR